MQAGYCTDIGKNRSLNEDAFLVMKKEGLFMVADGVGGQNFGELASGMAVRLLQEYVEKISPEELQEKGEISCYFLGAMERINAAINEAAASAPDREGMATTAVLAYIRGGLAYFVNLGDSRAYLIREGKIHQITEDHTFTNQMVREGSLTPREALHHPGRHMITRALGGEEVVKPDFFLTKVYEGDLFLLCSDGLYGDVSDQRILELSEKYGDNCSLLAKALVAEANLAGGGDNITVVAIRMELEEEV